MFRASQSVALIVGCLFLSTTVAVAQTVGDKIIVIAVEAELKVQSKVVRTVLFGTHLEIERVNGDWYWLRYDGTAGWVHRRDVIPFDRGIDFFTDLIRKKPTVKRLVCRAEIWAAKGEHENALRDLNEAIRLDPTDARLFNNRGNAWNDKGRFDRAIADFSEAIRVDPGCTKAYVGRAHALAMSGQVNRAIKDLGEAIRLDPKDSWNWHTRGMWWYAKEEFDNAIQDFTAANQIAPHARTYVLRAMAWHIKGEIANALDDYTEATRLDPDISFAGGNIAWLRATCPDANLRDGEIAVEFAIKDCELTKWNDAPSLNTLAAAYAESGEFEKAVETQEKARELAPKDEKADYQTRLDLYKSGKPYREIPKAPPAGRDRPNRSASAAGSPWRTSGTVQSAAEL